MIPVYTGSSFSLSAIEPFENKWLICWQKTIPTTTGKKKQPHEDQQRN
jgi:hypothetical protein